MSCFPPFASCYIRFVFAFLFGLFIFNEVTYGQVTNWTNSGSSNWDDSSSWSNGVPNSFITSNATITTGGTAVITPSTTTTTAILAIGAENNAGTLLVNGGYLITGNSEDTLLGAAVSSTGVALVESGTWVIDSGNLVIGNPSGSGVGTLIINGGVVQAQQAGSSPSYSVVFGTGSAGSSIELNGGILSVVGISATDSGGALSLNGGTL